MEGKMLEVLYICPQCKAEWTEKWSSACDSECDCGCGPIEATSWDTLWDNEYMNTYDVTLAGYTEAHNQYNQETGSDLYKAAEDLVKWINAPSLEAVLKFVDKNKLQLNEAPRQMREVEIGDGVDLILNEEGEVMDCEESDWQHKWEAQRLKVADLLTPVN